jgi:NAD(P)-dependent dehydrogenase (short-subunit alcohol dehydrogenase family)
MTGEALRGKVALISGTGSGQGRAAALRFTAEGCAVVGCDIDVAAASETVSLVRDSGGTMESVHPIDVSVDADVDTWIDHAVSTFGGFDILYNNAASFRRGTIETLSRDDWEATFANEILAVVIPVQRAVPHLRERGGGSIINIASIAGMVGLTFAGNARGNIAHCVGKAAVIRLTECLAIELSLANIRVNAISPGPVLTPAISRYFADGADPRFRNWIIDCGLVDRVGEADDVVNAALFLASDHSSFITGVNLAVDGGFTVSGGLGRPDHEIEEALAEMRTERR